MGMMDDAIKDTVKDKEFKKTDIKKLATRNKQIGGNHYKDCKIQPIDFIMENNEFIFCSTDMVESFACLELCNGKHKKVEECLMVYNKDVISGNCSLM